MPFCGHIIKGFLIVRVILREANYDDKDLLFEWVNDPISRKSAFSDELIQYEDHCKWFDNAIKSDDCIQLILMVDGIEVGQARFEIHNFTAELDYSIAPKYRLMGYGCILIEKSVLWIREHLPKVKNIVAKVKPENIASQRVLQNNCFEERYRCYEIDLNTCDERKTKDNGCYRGGYYT